MTESAGGRRERRVNGEPRPCCCCCCCCCCINTHSRPSCGLPGEEMSGENDGYPPPPPPPPLAGERKCNCCTSSSPRGLSSHLPSDDAESDARGEASGGGWLLLLLMGGGSAFVAWDLTDVSEGPRSMGLEMSGDLVGLGLRFVLEMGMGLGFVGLGLRLVFLGEGMEGVVAAFGAGERGILIFNGEPGVANENEFFFCTTFAPPPPPPLPFTSATDANELIDSFLLNTDTLLPVVVDVVVVVAVAVAVAVAGIEDETIPDFFITPSNLSFKASLLTFARREGTLPDRIIVLVGDESVALAGDGTEVEDKDGSSWGGTRTEM